MDGEFWNSAVIGFLTDGLHTCTRMHIRSHTHTHTHSLSLFLSLSLLSKSLTFPIPRESHESSAHDVFTFLITDWNFTFLCERICIKLHLWYKAVKFRQSVTYVWLWCWQNAFWEMCSLRYKISRTWSMNWIKNDEANTPQGARPILGSFAKTAKRDC